MSDPVPFLTAFGQALATLSLYAEGHPARERAMQAGHDALHRLLSGASAASFSFLSGEVVYGNRVLRELREWEWGARLAALGVERLEFVAPVEPGEFQAFVLVVHERLRAGSDRKLEPQSPRTGIRFGPVSLSGESLEELAAQVVVTTVPFDLTEEVEAVHWIHERIAGSDELPLIETETIIRSLALAMHQEGQVVLPLLELSAWDQYATTHACNTSVLAMGLAEYLGHAPREVRAVGVAAMLHDLGNVRLPPGLLRKPGALSDEERTLMMTHTAEGARLILARQRHLELAAVVAYEHHLDLTGGGYPTLVWPRRPHLASRLVRVCDVFDAAMTSRPWRQALGAEAALRVLHDGAGTHFDADLVQAFTTMIRQARVRRMAANQPVVEVEAVEPSSPGAGPAA